MTTTTREDVLLQMGGTLYVMNERLVCMAEKRHTVTRKAKCVYYRNKFGTNLSNKDFWKIIAF